jgi:hypothetical protein
MASDYMTKSVYDMNDNGAIDVAEGLRVLSSIPTDLFHYNDGDMIIVGRRVYMVRDL